MIDRLLKIANILDKSGNPEDADFMTGLIMAYKKAQFNALEGINTEPDYVDMPEKLEIPEEEFRQIQEVFRALLNDSGEG